MKSVGALLLSAALVLSLGTAAMAQVGLDLHGLYAFNFNDDDDGFNGDDTFGGGASLVFCLGDIVKLDLGGDYLLPENEDDSDVKAQLIPVTATLRIGVPIEEVAYLYVGGGGGYSFNDWDLKGGDDDLFDLEDCFTYHACGGAELLFSPNIGIRAEFRYIWLKPESKFKPTGTKTDVKFDHMQARGGLVLYF